MTSKEEVAEIMLEAKAITFSPSKPFKFTSGMLSPIYCDNRVLISDVVKRQKICEAFHELIKTNGIAFDVIAGTATAGIPHAAWLADKLAAPMVYVRADKKEHGQKNQVEGHIEKGQTVLLIEDHISTAGSVANAVEALRDAGANVEYVLSITTYGFKKAQDALEKSNVLLYTLTDFEALVREAKERKYITADEYKAAREWNKDPQGWAKKQGLES